ncbi:hypothetical protein BDF22DRAFT_667056 [Syncephalis plumigaleata]|nr:hypothetical protein BDF22DRAFT_667056 [Syncephalis plumigaleata]
MAKLPAFSLIQSSRYYYNGLVVALLMVTLYWTSVSASIIIHNNNNNSSSTLQLPTYSFFQYTQKPFQHSGLAVLLNFTTDCKLETPSNRTLANTNTTTGLVAVVNNNIYKSSCDSFNEVATEVYNSRPTLEELGYPRLTTIVLVSPRSPDSAGGPADKFCTLDADYSCYEPPLFARQAVTDPDAESVLGNSTDASGDVPMVFMNKHDGGILVEQLTKEPVMVTINSEYGSWNDYFLSKGWIIGRWVIFGLNDLVVLVAIQQLVTKYNSGYGSGRIIRNCGLAFIIIGGAFYAAGCTMGVLRPAHRALSDTSTLISSFSILLLLYLWITSLPTARNWHRSSIIITGGFVGLLDIIVCGVHIAHIPASFSSDHVAYSFTQMDTALGLVLITIYLIIGRNIYRLYFGLIRNHLTSFYLVVHYFRSYKKINMTGAMKRTTLKLSIITLLIMITWLAVHVTTYSYITPLAHTPAHSMALQFVRACFFTTRQALLLMGFSIDINCSGSANNTQTQRDVARLNIASLDTHRFGDTSGPNSASTDVVTPVSPVGTYSSRSALRNSRRGRDNDMIDILYDDKLANIPAFISMRK